MANTTKHTTLRLPVDLLGMIDQEAATESRSRAKVIELRLRRSYGHVSVDEPDKRAAVEGSGDGANVSVLRKPKGAEKRLHPVQPVRSELAGGRDAPAGLPEPRPASSANGKCPHGKFNQAYCKATGGGC